MARRASGSSALAWAGPSGRNPRCSNQSAVRVVRSTRRWMPLDRASDSAAAMEGGAGQGGAGRVGGRMGGPVLPATPTRGEGPHRAAATPAPASEHRLGPGPGSARSPCARSGAAQGPMECCAGKAAGRKAVQGMLSRESSRTEGCQGSYGGKIYGSPRYSSRLSPLPPPRKAGCTQKAASSASVSPAAFWPSGLTVAQPSTCACRMCGVGCVGVWQEGRWCEVGRCSPSQHARCSAPPGHAGLLPPPGAVPTLSAREIVAYMAQLLQGREGEHRAGGK